jgi:AraC-like DNA-binding protein
MISVDFATSKVDVINMVRPVVARALDWSPKFESSPHFHNCGQLVFASRGIMNILTTTGLWVVPPQRSVWMPANVPHVIRASTAVKMRTIYVDPSYAPWMPKHCCVLSVPPLLRELILKAMAIPSLYELGGPGERLMNVLIDEVSNASRDVRNLHLPKPQDPRVRCIVETIVKDPADPRTRDDWAKKIGASSRTIDRIFTNESGMGFGGWKRQAVLLESMRRLAEGESVTNVALDVGYDSPSAFIAMFRRTLGVTPSKLFK